jgi:hypothetical protein
VFLDQNPDVGERRKLHHVGDHDRARQRPRPVWGGQGQTSRKTQRYCGYIDIRRKESRLRTGSSLRGQCALKSRPTGMIQHAHGDSSAPCSSGDESRPIFGNPGSMANRGGAFRLEAEFELRCSQSKSEHPLNTLHIKRACHAEGRGFESRRSRQSFQWLSPRSRGRICFCPGRPPRDRRLRAASVPAASPRRRRFEHDCVPHQGVAIASHGLRRCGLIHFRAKTHCCLTHSLACAFLCAALRDESSFPGANPLDFVANRRSRPAQNRRMGGMFLC